MLAQKILIVALQLLVVASQIYGKPSRRLSRPRRQMREVEERPYHDGGEKQMKVTPAPNINWLNRLRNTFTIWGYKLEDIPEPVGTKETPPEGIRMTQEFQGILLGLRKVMIDDVTLVSVIDDVLETAIVITHLGFTSKYNRSSNSRRRATTLQQIDDTMSDILNDTVKIRESTSTIRTTPMTRRRIYYPPTKTTQERTEEAMRMKALATTVTKKVFKAAERPTTKVTEVMIDDVTLVSVIDDVLETAIVSTHYTYKSKYNMTSYSRPNVTKLRRTTGQTRKTTVTTTPMTRPTKITPPPPKTALERAQEAARMRALAKTVTKKVFKAAERPTTKVTKKTSPLPITTSTTEKYEDAKPLVQSQPVPPPPRTTTTRKPIEVQTPRTTTTTRKPIDGGEKNAPNTVWLNGLRNAFKLWGYDLEDIPEPVGTKETPPEGIRISEEFQTVLLGLREIVISDVTLVSVLDDVLETAIVYTLPTTKVTERTLPIPTTTSTTEKYEDAKPVPPPPRTTTARKPKVEPPPTTTTRKPKVEPPPTTTTRKPKVQPPRTTTTRKPIEIQPPSITTMGEREEKTTKREDLVKPSKKTIFTLCEEVDGKTRCDTGELETEKEIVSSTSIDTSTIKVTEETTTEKYEDAKPMPLEQSPPPKPQIQPPGRTIQEREEENAKREDLVKPSKKTIFTLCEEVNGKTRCDTGELETEKEIAASTTIDTSTIKMTEETTTEKYEDAKPMPLGQPHPVQQIGVQPTQPPTMEEREEESATETISEKYEDAVPIPLVQSKPQPVPQIEVQPTRTPTMEELEEENAKKKDVVTPSKKRIFALCEEKNGCHSGDGEIHQKIDTSTIKVTEETLPVETTTEQYEDATPFLFESQRQPVPPIEVQPPPTSTMEEQEEENTKMEVVVKPSKKRIFALCEETDGCHSGDEEFHQKIDTSTIKVIVTRTEESLPVEATSEKYEDVTSPQPVPPIPPQHIIEMEDQEESNATKDVAKTVEKRIFTHCDEKNGRNRCDTGSLQKEEEIVSSSTIDTATIKVVEKTLPVEAGEDVVESQLQANTSSKARTTTSTTKSTTTSTSHKPTTTTTGTSSPSKTTTTSTSFTATGHGKTNTTQHVLIGGLEFDTVEAFKEKNEQQQEKIQDIIHHLKITGKTEEDRERVEKIEELVEAIKEEGERTMELEEDLVHDHLQNQAHHEHSEEEDHGHGEGPHRHGHWVKHKRPHLHDLLESNAGPLESQGEPSGKNHELIEGEQKQNIGDTQHHAQQFQQEIVPSESPYNLPPVVEHSVQASANDFGPHNHHHPMESHGEPLVKIPKHVEGKQKQNSDHHISQQSQQETVSSESPHKHLSVPEPFIQIPSNANDSDLSSPAEVNFNGGFNESIDALKIKYPQGTWPSSNSENENSKPSSTAEKLQRVLEESPELIIGLPQGLQEHEESLSDKKTQEQMPLPNNEEILENDTLEKFKEKHEQQEEEILDIIQHLKITGNTEEDRERVETIEELVEAIKEEGERTMELEEDLVHGHSGSNLNPQHQEGEETETSGHVPHGHWVKHKRPHNQDLNNLPHVGGEQVIAQQFQEETVPSETPYNLPPAAEHLVQPVANDFGPHNHHHPMESNDEPFRNNLQQIGEGQTAVSSAATDGNDNYSLASLRVIFEKWGYKPEEIPEPIGTKKSSEGEGMQVSPEFKAILKGLKTAVTNDLTLVTAVDSILQKAEVIDSSPNLELPDSRRNLTKLQQIDETISEILNDTIKNENAMTELIPLPPSEVHPKGQTIQEREEGNPTSNMKDLAKTAKKRIFTHCEEKNGTSRCDTGGGGIQKKEEIATSSTSVANVKEEGQTLSPETAKVFEEQDHGIFEVDLSSSCTVESIRANEESIQKLLEGLLTGDRRMSEHAETHRRKIAGISRAVKHQREIGEKCMFSLTLAPHTTTTVRTTTTTRSPESGEIPAQNQDIEAHHEHTEEEHHGHGEGHHRHGHWVKHKRPHNHGLLESQSGPSENNLHVEGEQVIAQQFQQENVPYNLPVAAPLIQPSANNFRPHNHHHPMESHGEPLGKNPQHVEGKQKQNRDHHISQQSQQDSVPSENPHKHPSVPEPFIQIPSNANDSALSSPAEVNYNGGFNESIDVLKIKYPQGTWPGKEKWGKESQPSPTAEKLQQILEESPELFLGLPQTPREQEQVPLSDEAILKMLQERPELLLGFPQEPRPYDNDEYESRPVRPGPLPIHFVYEEHNGLVLTDSDGKVVNPYVPASSGHRMKSRSTEDDNANTNTDTNSVISPENLEKIIRRERISGNSQNYAHHRQEHHQPRAHNDPTQ